MDQDHTQVHEIPAGLVRIDDPETLHGWKLVEIGSAEHTAAVAALEAETQAQKDGAEGDDAAKGAATSRRRG